MQLIRNYCIILFLFLFAYLGKAQENLFTKADLSQQLKTVEQFVHYKIDSLRAKKNLKGLTNDKYLIEAAKMHANWMSEKGKLSHIQNKAKIKTPQKRVLLAGGNDAFIGENVAYTLFNKELTNKKGKTYINTTYVSVANDLVQMWRHSKGHYKNIINKGFNSTGIAFSVDFETNKIYATQVFGGQ